MRYLKAFNEQHESDWYTKLPEVIDECGDILLDLKDELLFNVEINLDLDNLIIIFIERQDNVGFYYSDVSEHIERLSIYIDSIGYKMSLLDSKDKLEPCIRLRISK